jgi:hypothetical protein
MIINAGIHSDYARWGTAGDKLCKKMAHERNHSCQLEVDIGFENRLASKNVILALDGPPASPHQNLISAVHR